ncbi:hypothetical protein DTO166G4_824 [Paecilomyces variotii]|nr:hypothetical protein DTO166G4_824 [Paecilomyces variotii]KAJ9243189.1 hypothetical protein DTO166G5_293 [Paecilomyces variotii]KAJ9310328.1 hypothetical protein DTO217A2_107 [Paecilomyces variotii]
MARGTIFSSARSTAPASTYGWSPRVDGEYMDDSWNPEIILNRNTGSQRTTKHEAADWAGDPWECSADTASTAMQTPSWDSAPKEEKVEAMSVSGACGSETPEPETSCTAPDRNPVVDEEDWDMSDTQNFWAKFKDLWGDEKTSDVRLYSVDGYPPVDAHWLFINMRTSAIADLWGGKDVNGKDWVQTDIDGRTLRRVIQYIYTGDYDTHVDYDLEHKDAEDEYGSWDSRCPEDIFGAHAHVYRAAQLYQIRGLTKICADKFENVCGNKWNSKSFSNAVDIIYFDTTFGVPTKSLKDKMKQLALQAAVDHAEELRHCPDFRGLLNNPTNYFASDLVLDMFRTKSESEWTLQGGWWD